MRKTNYLLLALALLALLPARSDLVGALLQTRTAGAKMDLPTGGNKKPPNPASFASTCAAWGSAVKDYLAILAILSPEW